MPQTHSARCWMAGPRVRHVRAAWLQPLLLPDLLDPLVVHEASLHVRKADAPVRARRVQSDIGIQLQVGYIPPTPILTPRPCTLDQSSAGGIGHCDSALTTDRHTKGAIAMRNKPETRSAPFLRRSPVPTFALRSGLPTKISGSRRLARVATPLAIVLAVSLAARDASAGNVTASASINTVGQTDDTSAGATASAYFPDPITPAAYALSSRTIIDRHASGGDRPVTQGAAASGTSYTNFVLWDLLGNAALDPAVAATLDVMFTYRFQGSTFVPMISLSTASAGFQVQNYYGSTYSEAGGSLTVVYGPVAPFPSEGYSITGDTRMLDNNYDFTVSLPHVKSATGQFYMFFQGGAGFKGVSSGTLSLESITLTAGSMPAGGLGVRLDPTGQIIPVTTAAVPEIDPAGFGSMATLVVGALGLIERRRKAKAA